MMFRSVGSIRNKNGMKKYFPFHLHVSVHAIYQMHTSLISSGLRIIKDLQNCGRESQRWPANLNTAQRKILHPQSSRERK
jgi:hypothetical protein